MSGILSIFLYYSRNTSVITDKKNTCLAGSLWNVQRNSSPALLQFNFMQSESTVNPLKWMAIDVPNSAQVIVVSCIKLGFHQKDLGSYMASWDRPSGQETISR